MSYLLGSEYCLQSLSSDVDDIQSAISDIINKTGKINSVSWKFPDKFACDLNIKEYLTTYKFDCNDSESSQISHIVLLELLIDRLCLILQLHCEFIDNSIIKDKPKSSSGKNGENRNNKTISPCLGLTSKKHWSKMIQLKIYLDNLRKENLEQKRENKELLLLIDELKSNSLKIEKIQGLSLNSENISQQASDWLKSMESDQASLKSVKKSFVGSISKDIGFKSCQTLDTAFKPCESCHVSQTCFRESSSVLMQILKEQSQTSSLYKLSQDLKSMDWLSDKKMMQIKESFGKDLDKICIIYKDIKKKEIKSNQDLSDCLKLSDNLKQELLQEKEQMKNERKTLENQRAQLESQVNMQTKSLKATQEEIHSMTNDFNNKYKQLQKEVADLNKEIIEKEKDCRTLEKLKISLADFQPKSDDPVKDLSAITNRILEQSHQIDSLNLALQNQRAVNNNLSDIETTFTDKENKLMKRLQNLSDQKHKLEQKIDSLEEKLETVNVTVKELEREKISNSLQMNEKISLIEKLTKTNEECNEKLIELQNQISNFEDTVLELEKEKQLLMHYPDLDGPLEKYETGDIISDIQMQINANNSRIKILSQQNVDLGNALEKLQWKSEQVRGTSATFHNSGDSHSSLETSSAKHELKLNISRPTSKMSSTFHSTSRQRPPRYSTPTKSAVTEPTNQVLQWSTTTQKSSVPLPLVCETCGRQYQQKSDLEIHKEYCAGRRRKNNQK